MRFYKVTQLTRQSHNPGSLSTREVVSMYPQSSNFCIHKADY